MNKDNIFKSSNFYMSQGDILHIIIDEEDYTPADITLAIELQSTPKQGEVVPDTLGQIRDMDGNTYTCITIGTQQWMVESLKTTHYADGSLIPLVIDNTDWTNDVTGAMCYYNNNITNKIPYGALYNYYAVVNARQLAVGQFTQNGTSSSGWRVPTESDFDTLIAFMGGDTIAGGKLKETGFTHWDYPNAGANNSSGFTGVAGGARGQDASFGNLLSHLFLGCSTAGGVYGQINYIIPYNDIYVTKFSTFLETGQSIRCVRDI